jgi:SPP1 family predicted phage head-tail adaptor
MNPGSLRYRVRIDSLNSTNTDAYGQITKSWTPYCTVWAGIKYLIGKELDSGGREVSINQVKIRIRWREDINPDMRVVHNNVIYDINNVMPDMAHRMYVDLLCSEGSDDGGGA